MAVTPEKDLAKWEPIVLTFEYKFLKCREPCVCPCCCCPCCYHPLSCCMSQEAKIDRVHEAICANYVKNKIFGRDAIAVSFSLEKSDGGYKVIEMFRNIDAAEAYYDHFMKDKMLMCYVLTNLPWRQAPGTNAVVEDGNVKAYITNPARLSEGPQTVKFNHLKIAGNPKGKVEVVEWATAPSPQELESQFGRLHFGWRHNPSLAQTDTMGSTQETPIQEIMQ
mmetsp:Transcript_106610/g.296665  ORF Transcript_106610/g.296665 Transcript_106610/m.296665 type:complete len:222 (-) Transcript_106610:76-741(-)